MNKKTYTLLGLLAILLWGAGPAYTKILGDGMGPFMASGIANLVAGILVIIKQRFVDGRVTTLSDGTKRYWLVCGFFFVLYQAVSYYSLAIVSDNSVVVTVILIRFLWPLAALLLTIPILGKKANWWLILTVSISFVGIVLSQLGKSNVDLVGVVALAKANVWPYILSLILALTWGFYTNFSKCYIKEIKGDGLGIFMILSALFLFVLSFVVGERTTFTQALVWPMIYTAIIAGFIGYMFWNLAVTKGETMTVVLISNFLPVISAISSSITLGIPVTITTCVGGLLVATGTILSKQCFEKE